MQTNEQVDFGVLDPKTTEVLEFPNGFHRFLRCEKGGPMHWPYPPELLQRRKNQHRAALGILVEPHPERLMTILPLLDSCLHEHKFQSEPVDFFDFCRSLHRKGADVLWDLRCVLIKMQRPGTPQGWEWDAPGGIAEPKEWAGAHIRKIREEMPGTTIVASSLLFQNVQFASGCLKEWYDIHVVLVPRVIGINQEEGAGDVTYVCIGEAQETFERWAAVSPEDPSCSWVDGKVILGVERILSRFSKF
jgi:hypothetical protein